MSTLFGNNISQTYQGLIKLADSTTGVTSTTQSLQDGLGNNIPIQVSDTIVNISGSFLVNGKPVEIDTGSFVLDVNGYNYPTETDTIKVSFGDGTTQSFVVNNVGSSSYAETASFALNVPTNLATTGSNIFIGDQTITGSVNITNNITANSASFNYLHTVYETASVIYSSGSNQLGDELSDIQILSGSVQVQGSLTVNGLSFTSGTSGTSGSSGSSGSNGSSGTSGSSGSSGSNGSSGTAGSSGTSGTSGTSGSNGTSGSSGSNGSSGTSGSSGSTGTSGTSGSNGSSGTSGIDGTSGTSGSNGSSGTSGTAGTSGTSGSSGSSGSSGISNSFFNYQAKTNTQSGNPGNGYVIWNNVTQSGSTQINVSDTDQPGNNVDVFLSQLKSGSRITFQDKSNQGNYQVWDIGTSVDNTSYWSYPVTLVSSTHEFNNNDEILFIITTTPSGTSGTSGSSGTSGINGTSGTSGSNGSSGTAGTSGTSGVGYGLDAKQFYFDNTGWTTGGGLVYRDIIFNLPFSNTNYNVAIDYHIGNTNDTSNGLLANSRSTSTTAMYVVDVRNKTTTGCTIAFENISGNQPTTAGSEVWVSCVANGEVGVPGTSGSSGSSGTSGTSGSNGTSGTTGATGAQGANAGFTYTFSSDTTAPPPSSQFEFNNAQPSGTTIVYISYTDANSNDLNLWLQSFSGSTSTMKGYLFIVLPNGTKYQYQVTGITRVGTGSSTYYSVNVIWNGGYTFDVIPNTQNCQLSFIPTGNIGASGSSGTSGISGSSGTSGISGSSGTSGTSGADGLVGSNGTSGTSGINGSSGTSGVNGTSGTDGSSGTSGVSGSSGSSGTSGVVDYTGLITTGSIGAQQAITGSLLNVGTILVQNQSGTRINTIGPNTFNINTTQDPTIQAQNYVFASTGSNAQFYIGVYDDPTFTTDVEYNINVDNTGIKFNDWDNGSTFSYIPWLSIAPNVGDNPIPQFTRGLNVTGAFTVNGSPVSADRNGLITTGSISQTQNITGALVINNGFFPTVTGGTGSANLSIWNTPTLLSSGSINNIFIGAGMDGIKTGSYNTVVGMSASKFVSGSYNTYFGGGINVSDNTGSFNTSIGYGSGVGGGGSGISYNNNLTIGYYAGEGATNTGGSSRDNNFFLHQGIVPKSGSNPTTNEVRSGSLMYGTFNNTNTSNQTLQLNANVDVRYGLKVTGSLNITGSLTLNGTPITAGGGGGVTQITGVTFVSQSWSLSSSLYIYDYSNTGITANSVVSVIPSNASIQTVINAQLLPQTDSSAGSVRLYASYRPTNNITSTINIQTIS